MKTILLHVSVWICFISYEVSIAIRLGSKATVFDFACFYVLNIGLFYFNAHVASQWAGRKQSVALFAAVLILELGVYDLLSIGMDIFVNSVANRHLVVAIYPADHVRSLWRGIYFLSLSTGYYFALRSIRNLKLKLEAERREAALENAHLRAQINPHWLYNVINFIYNDLVDISPRAADSLMMLAHSMRYAMMAPQEDGLVELYKEVEQIDRLIRINQVISGERIAVINQIGEECFAMKKRIPPMLLLTFVENVFKHGNLFDAPAKISLNANDNGLHLRTENLRANRRVFASEHIGIDNAKARLKKYYNNNFVLEQHDNGSTFILDLKLNL
ncbi:MAG: histidine kinase [Bacteroidetes bacterium]|nr:histidine kinase [Bacteroidota bacterium]